MSNSDTIADPRYPVGRFSAPAGRDAAALAGWRSDLSQLPERMRAAVGGLTDVQLDTPYREDGWTVRQVVHHVPDSHLNAYCRFKLALTEESPTIKPYLEARWAELPDARLPVAPSLALLDGLHARWLSLIDAMTPADWDRTFTHPEHQRTVTLWYTAAMYAWHSRHHVAHITALRARRAW
ncbi:MAG: YfiT family bacillithiol transferase [Gemmatimonadales bacterium]